MSFCESVKKELAENLPKKSCCRKSMLCGLLYDAEIEKGGIKATFAVDFAASLAIETLKAQFSVTGRKENFTNAGKHYTSLEFELPLMRKILLAIGDDTSGNIENTAGFRCKDCGASFLKGTFIALATVNEPKSGYHLEFLVSNDESDSAITNKKAEKLARLLSGYGFSPKTSRRRKKAGLYYKNNTAVSDILYFVGAPKSSFYVANTYIENDIRNNENRATNCVAQNISKSIGAAQKHISAIKHLIAENRLCDLSPDLLATANLRIENDSATLSELANLHIPPISKSGLNHRLEKICRIAEEG